MDNNDIQSQIDELRRRLDARDAQQITFPLDVQSINVLNRYFLRIVDSVVTTGGVSGQVFVQYVGNQNGTKVVMAEDTYVPYTVDTTTNVFTVNSAYFPNDTVVNVYTSDTVPSPLSTGTNYYVVNSTGLTFKLSTSLGGTAIDITTTGTGTQYVSTF